MTLRRTEGERGRKRTGVASAVVVASHEVEELVAGVGRLALDDAVLLEPGALHKPNVAVSASVGLGWIPLHRDHALEWRRPPWKWRRETRRLTR